MEPDSGVLIARLTVSREASRPAPKLSQPREVACFSKGRDGVAFDRRGLRAYEPPQLPVDLNIGFDLFQDRDRSNPHPAPLANILRSLEAHGQEAELLGVRFVTFRGNVAKLLLSPYNDKDEWHIELEKQNDTIFMNVTEPPAALQQAAADATDTRKRMMQYWGFAFEEACSAGGAGLKLGIDSTEGFNSVAVTSVGQHKLLIASEVDTEVVPRRDGARGRSIGGHGVSSSKRVASSMEHYVELKTSRLMDRPRQVENFEKHKLLRWWAQSYPAGVPRVVVGFRDDDGFVQKIQELQTAKLPKYVAGKPHAWDADICVSFLDRALSWIEAELSTARTGQRFRLVYCPKQAREIRLLRDCRIPAFVSSSASFQTSLYSVCADDRDKADVDPHGEARVGGSGEEPARKQPRMY